MNKDARAWNYLDAAIRDGSMRWTTGGNCGIVGCSLCNEQVIRLARRVMQDGVTGQGLKSRLKEKARKLGFSMIGVVEARPSRRLDAYLRWLQMGYHGSMGWMARPDRQARRKDLSVILPGVRSLVSVGLDYATLEPPPEIASVPSRGRISSYAWGVDYHDMMTPRLKELGNWLAQEAGGQVSNKVYVDTGAILERSHAAEAGLGFVGKNTMLIGPRRGSWFFLGELLTTVALPPDEPQAPLPTCGSCRRCLDACPTNAFPEPYVLDARRCISYLTIELKGWIPRELRPLMANWVYGCDVCQTVCPWNRFAPRSQEVAFQPPDYERVAPPLLDLLALDEAAFQERFGGSPIARIGRSRLVRNTCVAAGNWGSVHALPGLIRLLGDEEAVVRGHAAWAIGRIAGKRAKQALQASLQQEESAIVREEIEFALVTFA